MRYECKNCGQKSVAVKKNSNGVLKHRKCPKKNGKKPNIVVYNINDQRIKPEDAGFEIIKEAFGYYLCC